MFESLFPLNISFYNSLCIKENLYHQNILYSIVIYNLT